MKSFSLVTLLLLIAICALTASHFMTSQRLRVALAEVETIRHSYGYIKVTDKSKVYVSSIAQSKGTNRDSLRFCVPPGQRYFLHLTETKSDPGEFPPIAKPFTTICLNTWTNGNDEILSYGINLNPAKQTPYLRVGSRNDHFFTYAPDDWPNGIPLSVVSSLETDPQREFETDDAIV